MYPSDLPVLTTDRSADGIVTRAADPAREAYFNTKKGQRQLDRQRRSAQGSGSDVELTAANLDAYYRDRLARRQIEAQR